MRVTYDEVNMLYLLLSRNFAVILEQVLRLRRRLS